MEILLPTKIKRELVEEFKVSRMAVWRALAGKSNGRVARMIRVAALERGGRVYDGTVRKEGLTSKNKEA